MESTLKRQWRGSWRATDFPEQVGPGLLMGTYRPEGDRTHYEMTGKLLYALAVHFVARETRAPGDPRQDLDERLYIGQSPFAIGSDEDQDGDPLTDADSLVFEGSLQHEQKQDGFQEVVEVEWDLRPEACAEDDPR